jgi:mannosyltransferase
MNISIITIVLNDKQNIEKTIESVLSQGVEIEYIIIDGGSTDGTLDVIGKYKDKIDILVSEKDSGIYNAMNRAIDMASGEWICFMNSGDMFYDSNVLKTILPKLDDSIDIVYGDQEVRYTSKTKIVKANISIQDIWKGMIFSHQSCFVKKNILKEYRFNESNRITADYELFYNLFKANKKFSYIPMIVASVNAGGVSDIKRIESLVSRWKIINKSFGVNIYYLKLIMIELVKVPMKIVYDNIIYSLQKAGGISAYWSELSARFLDARFDIAFYGYPNDNIFMSYLDIDFKKESSINYKINRYLDFQQKLPQGSIFHSSYYRIANQKDVVNITTVHDFTYEYYRSGLAKFIHSWQKGRAINKSDGIICISENTKKDLLKFYPNIKEEKIEVIYNGVSDTFCQLNEPSQYLKKSYPVLENKKYILYVGDRNGYKNFDIAVKVVEQIHNCILVIVGGENISDKEKELFQKEYLHFQGISTKDLNILYNNAFCLLYPSSYEGFGIPIAEAMKAGCPVVSSNRSSIQEVADDAGLLVDKIEVEEFVKVILKLENKEFRDKLILKGLEQAKKFSWDKCFEETLEFYKEVVGKKFK